MVMFTGFMQVLILNYNSVCMTFVFFLNTSNNNRVLYHFLMIYKKEMYLVFIQIHVLFYSLPIYYVTHNLLRF